MIGEAKVISSIPVPEIDAYHRARYTAPNIVVAAAGNLEHETIVELAERHCRPPAADGPGLALEPPEADGAQVRLPAEGHRAVPRLLRRPGHRPRRRAALSRSAILDAVFGGSTSSRLFREVREKRGLAYAVGSYTQQFVDGGLVGLYVGTREDNVEEACEVIGDELAQLHAEGITRRRADPSQGARQGPDGPVERVHGRPDGADRRRRCSSARRC